MCPKLIKDILLLPRYTSVGTPKPLYLLRRTICECLILIYYLNFFPLQTDF